MFNNITVKLVYRDIMVITIDILDSFTIGS